VGLLVVLGWRVVAQMVALAIAAGAVSPHGLLPPTSLPLSLAGVRIDRETASQSASLIRCTYRHGEQRSYRVGQVACEVAEITEIQPDAVVIKNLLTKRAERLVFPSTSPPANPSPLPPPSPPVVTVTREAVAVDLAKGSVDHYLENLNDLLDAALASPRLRESADGERRIDGFEIGRIKEAGLVEQLGLRNGDVILEVNGQSLDSLATVIQLFGQIQTMAQVKVTVLRNGLRVPFVFNRK